LDIIPVFQLTAAIIIAFFLAYNLLHYVLFVLATRLKDASKIGHQLNPFEQRQLVEWAPQPSDFLKHDDEKRTFDDVFGTYRDEQANYSTCVFPRAPFSGIYESEYALLKPKDGMRLLDLGCGSGAAADYLASRRNIEIVCVTNSTVQADICRRKFAKHGGRAQVIVTDFDSLDFPSESFDAIYSLESVGYSKDLDAWLARCWRMLKPGGRLLIRTPGSLDHCRREKDYLSVTEFFENWRYNFVGANLLVYKMRRLGFDPIRYRRLPFWAWGLTWNCIQHMLLWKYHLKMRTFVHLEKIIWRTSKVFVFGNPYNTVLAFKPETASSFHEATLAPSERVRGVGEGEPVPLSSRADRQERARRPVPAEEGADIP
jgi:SAM-dependent methyltransferase